MRRAERNAESWAYVPVDDRSLPPNEQTRITLRPLTVAERMRAWDDMNWTSVDPKTETRTITSRAFQEAYRLTLDCVVSVENFPPESPKEWPSDRKERMTYLEMFPDTVILEIGNEIVGHSILGTTEKNS